MKQKQNRLPKKLYDHLLDNEKQLKDYLTYIRQKQPPHKIVVESPFRDEKKCVASSSQKCQSKHNSINILQNNQNKSTETYLYVQKYIKTLKEVSALESSSSKKIFKKTLQFLEEFPSMNFLYEVINSFGKDQKKLSMNQNVILSYATDEMIPLFQKIIQRIEQLRKQAESKKLMELGHRIQHLQGMVNCSKHSGYQNQANNSQINRIFEKFEGDRIEKYLVMEDNLLKAEKKFGNFSQNFIKSREIFSNLNKVYQDIKKHEK